jgi:hypothetical protein
MTAVRRDRGTLGIKDRVMAEPFTLTHREHESGLAPGSRTKCEGVFRVQEDTGRGPIIMQCDGDGCTQLIGVARKLFEAGRQAPGIDRLPDPDLEDAMESGAF